MLKLRTKHSLPPNQLATPAHVSVPISLRRASFFLRLPLLTGRHGSKAYGQAMEAVAASYPEEHEATIFCALALCCRHKKNPSKQGYAPRFESVLPQSGFLSWAAGCRGMGCRAAWPYGPPTSDAPRRIQCSKPADAAYECPSRPFFPHARGQRSTRGFEGAQPCPSAVPNQPRRCAASRAP